MQISVRTVNWEMKVVYRLYTEDIVRLIDIIFIDSGNSRSYCKEKKWIVWLVDEYINQQMFTLSFVPISFRKRIVADDIALLLLLEIEL